MIRLITEQVPAPHFFLLCDHPHCGQYISGLAQPPELPASEQFDPTKVSRAPDPFQLFIGAAQQQGWAVTPFTQLCKHHNGQPQSLITLPGAGRLIQ